MYILQVEKLILLMMAFGAVFGATLYLQEQFSSLRKAAKIGRNPVRINTVALVDWLIILITVSLLIYFLR